jgi:hypothetical protein
MRLGDRRVLWLALGIAAGLRGLAWWWAAAPDQDELSYQATARWLIEHGQQRLFWPPLTPWLLAAVFTTLGPVVGAARLLWLGLDLVNLGLAWRLASAVLAAPAASGTGPVPWRGLVVLAHAVSLPAISHAIHTTSETPALTLLLALLLLLRPQPSPAPQAASFIATYGRAALAGLCGGALVLNRPSLGLVPLALAAVLLRESWTAAGRRRAFGQAALLVGLTTLVAGGYVLRNRLVTGHAVLAENATYDFHRGNGPVYQEDLDLFWPVATPQQIAYRQLRANQREEPPLSMTPAQLRREALTYIEAHPGTFVRRALGRLARLTVPRTEHLALLGGEARIKIEDGRSIALLLMGVLQWAPLLLLGTIGLLGLRLRPPGGDTAWANRFLTVVAAGIIPVLITISKPRFSYGFEPLLSITAAAFLANRGTWRPLLRHPVFIALVAFYAWAWVAWFVFAVTSRTGS